MKFLTSFFASNNFFLITRSLSLKNNSKADTHYIKSIDLVSEFLNAGKRNLVIFMGAGDISSQAVSFVNRQKVKS